MHNSIIQDYRINIKQKILHLRQELIKLFTLILLRFQQISLILTSLLKATQPLRNHLRSGWGSAIAALKNPLYRRHIWFWQINKHYILKILETNITQYKIKTLIQHSTHSIFMTNAYMYMPEREGIKCSLLIDEH